MIAIHDGERGEIGLSTSRRVVELVLSLRRFSIPRPTSEDQQHLIPEKHEGEKREKFGEVEG